MKVATHQTRETLVDAICAAACFLGPLLLLALFVGSPSWSRDRAPHVEASDVAPVQYAIQATRLNPYIEIF